MGSLNTIPKILVVASKCPNDPMDCDGGGRLVSDFSKILPRIAEQVDFLFLRKPVESWLATYRHGKTHFIDEENIHNDKFYSRVYASKAIAQIIQNTFDDHSIIIIVHASNAFGISEHAPDLLKHIILFPMFTSASYEKFGQRVPSEYRALEKKALLGVRGVSSPSKTERDLICSQLPELKGAVSVIPRIVSLTPHKEETRPSPDNTVRFVNIASMKLQKNQIFLMHAVRKCLDHKINIECHLVGGIQDQGYAQKVYDTIDSLGLQDNVVIHGECLHSDVIRIAKRCHINVCTSYWETFCRGFYEGLLLGMPCVAPSDLNCIWENCIVDGRVKAFDRTTESFLSVVTEMMRNNDQYNLDDVATYTYLFSEKRIASLLEKELIIGVGPE